MSIDHLVTATEIRRALRHARHHAIKRATAYTVLAIGALAPLAAIIWITIAIAPSSQAGIDGIISAAKVMVPAAAMFPVAYVIGRELLLTTAGGELSREDEDALRQTLADLENGRPRT